MTKRFKKWDQGAIDAIGMIKAAGELYPGDRLVVEGEED